MSSLRSRLQRRLIRRLALVRSRRRFAFCGCRFAVSPGVLNPSAFRSSLLFAKEALRIAGPEPISALELGSGSGLASVLLAHRGHRVTAVDRSYAALRDTQANSRRNGVSIRVLGSDWDAGLDPTRRWNLVLSNPPFLPAATAELETALWAGPNLEHLVAVLEAVRRRVASGGQALLLSSERTGRHRFLELVGECDLVVIESTVHRLWGERFFIDRLRGDADSAVAGKVRPTDSGCESIGAQP